MVTVNWLVAVPFAAWSWSMLSSNVLRALPAFNVISYHIHYDSFSVIWGAKPICLNPQILEMFPCKIASCKKKSDHQKNSKWLTQPVYLFPLMRLVKFEWTSQDNDVTISGDYRNRSKKKKKKKTTSLVCWFRITTVIPTWIVQLHGVNQSLRRATWRHVISNDV